MLLGTVTWDPADAQEYFEASEGISSPATSATARPTASGTAPARPTGSSGGQLSGGDLNDTLSSAVTAIGIAVVRRPFFRRGENPRAKQPSAGCCRGTPCPRQPDCTHSLLRETEEPQAVLRERLRVLSQRWSTTSVCV